MANYDKEVVKKAADENWLAIFANLAPELRHAIQRVGRHVPCPIKGGTDGFRLMPDADVTGAAFHNDPSIRFLSNGFEVLMWLRNWSFSETIDEVGQALGLPTAKPTQTKRLELVAAHDPKKAKFYDGILIAFGKERYQFKDENELSFYAILRYRNNLERTLWGVDIERALAESGATYGDSITLSNLGRVPVTIVVEKKDKDGVITEEEIKTHRNTWEVIRIGETRLKSTQASSSVVKHVQVSNGSPVAVTSAKQAVETADEVSAEPIAAHQKVVPINKALAAPGWLQEAQQRAANVLAAKAAGKAYASEKIEKVWNQCVAFPSATAEPMRLYLQSRGVLFNELAKGAAADMRFHPALDYYEEVDNKNTLLGSFPAIVCAIRNAEGEIVTLHRTYLNKDGKKLAVSYKDSVGQRHKVEKVKKMMSIPDDMDVNGSAVRLGDPSCGGVLGIAEGLETALSAYRATKIPTWSSVNAQLMETFEIPESVHTLLIWADKDKSVRGEIAANVLYQRAKALGLNVHILMPSMPIPAKAKGVDWNDVLLSQGILGFPRVANLKSFIARSFATI
ncbi:DUF7146 domain-containing protein [Comamonas testosteroni]|uniref:DUF7146 domain-containing protein n=1 Tax=Comamonas testosteroni TaxID=285 RepID=UPI0005531870|nr:toprim domain-containing protein [Comamonas testosteroni]WKL18815.1 toprim domain-containing protein [Comamonas testosteroni]